MNRFRHLFVILATCITLSGCLGTQYLGQNEQLLYKQRIKGTENVDKEELSELYQQEANKRPPFLPFSYLVYVHEIGKVFYNEETTAKKREKINKRYDKKIAKNEGNPKKIARLISKKNSKIAKVDRTLKEGNVAMRMGEPVAVWDRQKTENTRQRMEKYLRSKGYFQAEVTFSIDSLELENAINLTYKVDEGEPHKLAEISYHSQDSSLLKIVKQAKAESLIQVGQNYEQSKLSAERERLDILLQNKGYFDFNRQYIELFVDTASLPGKQTEVQVHILKPAKRKKHKIFRVDSVIFTTDANIKAAGRNRKTSVNEGVTFRYYEDKFSQKILSRRVAIKPDSLYSKESTFRTQRQLANMDMFKFVNVNYDTTGGKFIANIYTSPLPKFQVSHELGVNMNQGFKVPGPFYNLTFKNRNLFGGMEVLSVSGLVSSELTASNGDNSTRETEIGGNLSLSFPQFILPLGSRLQKRLGSVNPKTTLTAGYSNIDRQYYKLTNFRTNVAYNWQKQNRQFYNFTLMELTFNDAQFKKSDDGSSNFEDFILSSSKRLRSSFESSFVTSTNMTATFNFGGNAFNSRRTSFLKLSLENGGTLENLLDVNLFENDNGFKYHYFRFNVDYRKSIPVSKKSSFAYRVNVGTAAPYGSNNSMPYLKHFFAGGSYGIRAWGPRQLGPGSYNPALDPNAVDTLSSIFEQHGELLFETSIEFRHPIFSFVNGAFFVDAGNIWMLSPDERQNPEIGQGANFKWDRFYKEIAVGAGYGIRLDFSFLLVRFDTAIKIFDPSQREGERFVGKNIDFSNLFGNKGQAVFNLGIGYPF